MNLKLKLNTQLAKIIEDIDIKNENFTHTLIFFTFRSTNSNNFISEYQ